jgi:predicted RNase H-like HicB family nuclease
MATRLEYMRAAMAKAKFETTEKGTCFAYIPGFDGLWAKGSTRERAREELFETLDGWLDVHTKIANAKAPEVDGMTLESPPKLLAD